MSQPQNSANSLANPACMPADCSQTNIGPCAADAPPWPRATACNNSFGPEDSAHLQMRRKAEVLQHKHNAFNLSKKRTWSKMVTGRMHNKKTVWGTQNHGYTNPNTQNLSKQPNSFVLTCPNNGSTGNSIIRYSSSASDVPGNTTLWLDKTYPAWGVGLRKFTFSNSNVKYSRGLFSIFPSQELPHGSVVTTEY